MGQSTSNEGRRNDRGNALPKDDPPDVTRFKSAAAKRVQAHRARARMGLRCLTVRVSDREVRHLISTGYLSFHPGLQVHPVRAHVHVSPRREVALPPGVVIRLPFCRQPRDHRWRQVRRVLA